MWHIGILTASDKGSRGEREDASAAKIRDIVHKHLRAEITSYRIVADERSLLSAEMIRMVDEESVDLLLTTGGTGLSPRDVTPEATLDVIDRQAPGFGEVMRAATLEKTRRAMLSRSIAGTRGKTLIINLPGSPKGVEECLEAIIDVIPHALAILTGLEGDHAPTQTGGG